MNGKRAKRNRKKAKQLLIEWLHTMVPEGEDKSKINLKNLDQFLPKQTHIFANNKFMLSAYSLKWFYKKVKKNPNITLKEIIGGLDV
jgi:hypothetical protein|tara:strand:+ start:366 stop:626 length:261 start_codon:yes stop_codon:yes gene_type:complete